MDKLAIGIAREGFVRIYSVVTTDLTDEARRRHDLWPTSSAALGRTMAVALMMGAMSKSDQEKVNIQINGEGPIKTIVAQSSKSGNVRGYVGEPHVMLSYTDKKKLAVGLAVGPGFLNVTKSMGMKTDFVGTVDLVSGEIAEDFAYYFNVSEQTPSAVSLGVLVETDNSVVAAGGLIIQLLPGAREEDIIATEAAFGKLKPISEMVKEGATAESIIENLFDDARVLETRDVQFKCQCSRELMLNGLATLDSDEIKAMIEEDEIIETVCHYCNEKYLFTIPDLQGLLDAREA
ncbi:MAG: Hsp33 family molecular chaperone HslO [Erysipelothrix sp.]|nr:Hsp33 family molecular chaperone HslO [Erysipelothrix sp.]